MTNPHKGHVVIPLNGDDYTIRYDMNSLAEIEEHFGKPLKDVLSGLKDGMDIKMIRQLLFHGLQAEHSDVFQDVKSAGKGMMSIVDSANLIGRALSLAMTGKEPSRKIVDIAESEDPLLTGETTEGPGTGGGS